MDFSITSVETIPNILATVEGEPSLYEKLTPFLETAEFWIETNFAPHQIISDQVTISGEPRNLIKQLVTYHAFFIAIPSLDLVLTPNGFGIVNNSNIAPASKERMERLMTPVEKQRDDVLEQYLRYTFLYNNYSYLQSGQGKNFFATLFPNLDLCNRCGITEHRWQEYQRLDEKRIVIETALENEYFSAQQMKTFRRRILNWSYNKPDTLETTVIESIRNLEISILTDGKPHPQTARDIVNIIRSEPTLFSDWAHSDTAKLFTPEVFLKKSPSETISSTIFFVPLSSVMLI